MMPRQTDGPVTRQSRLAHAAMTALLAEQEWDADLHAIVVVSRRDPGSPQDGTDGLVMAGVEDADEAGRMLASAAKAVYAIAGVPSIVQIMAVPNG